METKKSKKANLENIRGILFNFGLIITLGLLFLAFEWKSPNTKIVETNLGTTIFETDIVQITKREKPLTIPIPRLNYGKLLLIDNNVKPDFRAQVFLPDNWGDDFIMNFEDLSNEDDTPEPFYKFPEKPAEFPGNLDEFLKKNTIFPESARRFNIQGIVYLKFRIDSNGNIKDIEVVRGIDPTLDEEAKRVIGTMPQWKPAEQGDQKVATEMGISIKFILKD